MGKDERVWKKTGVDGKRRTWMQEDGRQVKLIALAPPYTTIYTVQISGKNDMSLKCHPHSNDMRNAGRIEWLNWEQEGKEVVTTIKIQTENG